MSRQRRLLLRLVPAASRTSVEAIRAEAGAMEDEALARRWRAAARRRLIEVLLLGPGLTAAATVVVIAAVAACNASASDEANQAALACILLGSAVLGMRWRRPWIPGLVVGAVVAVQHAVALALRLPEPPLHLPPGALGVASLLVLTVPAVVAASLGAALRTLLRS